MIEEKEYSKENVKKYLKKLKIDFPDVDSHLLEVALLQYFLMDCNENYKANEINEDYERSKLEYNKKEYACILFNDEIKNDLEIFEDQKS